MGLPGGIGRQIALSFFTLRWGQEWAQPPFQRAHWFPGTVLSALQGPALGTEHLGTHLTKRETEARSGDIPLPGIPQQVAGMGFQQPICLSQTWGRSETSGGDPGSSHPALPLWGFRTHVVQVRILSLPPYKLCDPAPQFPHLENGHDESAALLRYSMDSRRVRH